MTSYWQGKRILVTGGAGFLGSYVVENLAGKRGVDPGNIVVPRSKEHDLRRMEECLAVTQGCQVVIHLAAVTGGIEFSSTHPASQYFDSTRIDLNMIEAARRSGVEKFVAIGNLFAYSQEAATPLEEECLFSGLPGGAHRGVGWLKRNLAVMADLYYREHRFPMVVVYSANGYGPRDSADRRRGHVIPATIMKCLEEEELLVWGDGSPTRDFLFAGDIAEGLALAAERLEAPEFVNIGSGREVSIRELVGLIARYTGFSGRVTFDASRGGGSSRRCASVAKAHRLLGFEAAVSLEEGLEHTVAWFKSRVGQREQS